ncbi:hypothetical protein DFH27DRAFT_532250 [Peziza echinospora]|nr:hypothetical protein DFH27DRAFT_532250 [Peziza echinospora]
MNDEKKPSKKRKGTMQSHLSRRPHPASPHSQLLIPHSNDYQTPAPSGGFLSPHLSTCPLQVKFGLFPSCCISPSARDPKEKKSMRAYVCVMCVCIFCACVGKCGCYLVQLCRLIESSLQLNGLAGRMWLMFCVVVVCVCRTLASLVCHS